MTHYAAFNATVEQLDELEQLTRDMAEATDWSAYHQADERFHQLVGTASGMGAAVEVYHETLAELYDYFIPYPIEKLHKSNDDHIALVAALRAGRVEEAVEVSRKHVEILHRTMFMGLTQPAAKPRCRTEGRAHRVSRRRQSVGVRQSGSLLYLAEA